LTPARFRGEAAPWATTPGSPRPSGSKPASAGETSCELAADAVGLVNKWNADIERRKDAHYGYAARRRYPQFSPHIGAAILASKPFLRLLCPACKQQGDVDLRTVVRPSDFPIDGLYDALT
jgi:hypothetical protein